MKSGNKDLTIALLGAGIWGQRILYDLRDLGVNLHVIDPDPAALERARLSGVAHTHQTADMLSIPGLLDQIDGIVLASPASLTADLLTDILPTRKPVFIEKPLATSVDKLALLKPLAHEQAFMMHVWQYHPAVRALAGLAGNGCLGEILGLRSVRTGWTSPRRDIDSLWNLGVHDLTISKAILGHIPPLRAAQAEWHGQKIRGALVLLGDKPFHWIELSNRYADKRREIRLHGSTGVAVWRSDDDDFLTITRGDDACAISDSESERLTVDTTPALKIELQAFCSYLLGGNPPPSSLADGFETVARLAQISARLAPNAPNASPDSCQ